MLLNYLLACFSMYLYRRFGLDHQAVCAAKLISYAVFARCRHPSCRSYFSSHVLIDSMYKILIFLSPLTKTWTSGLFGTRPGGEATNDEVGGGSPFAFANH